MIRGQAPFRARKEKTKREFVDRRVREKVEEYTPRFSVNAEHICRQLLKKDPLERLGCNVEESCAIMIKNHPFFQTVHWTKLEAGMIDPIFVPDVRFSLFVFSSKIILIKIVI